MLDWCFRVAWFVVCCKLLVISGFFLWVGLCFGFLAFLLGITLIVACPYASAGSMWDSSCSAVMVWVLPLDVTVCIQVLFCFRMVWYVLPSLDLMMMVHSSFLMQDSLVRWDLC
jgi:hypothetical protein